MSNRNERFAMQLNELQILNEQMIGKENYINAWVSKLKKWWSENKIPGEPPPEVVETVRQDVAMKDIEEVEQKLGVVAPPTREELEARRGQPRLPRDANAVNLTRFVPWCLKCILEMPTDQSHLFFEDLAQTKGDLEVYSKALKMTREEPGREARNVPILNEHERNINNYDHKSLHIMLEEKELFGEQSKEDKEKIDSLTESGEIEVLHDGDGIRILGVKSFQAGQETSFAPAPYGNGTWCTGKYFGSPPHDYIRAHWHGDQEPDKIPPEYWLYDYIIKKNPEIGSYGEHIQVHFPTGQVMNRFNQQLGDSGDVKFAFDRAKAASKSNPDGEAVNDDELRNQIEEKRKALRAKLIELTKSIIKKKKPNFNDNGLRESKQLFTRMLGKLPLYD